MMIIGSLTVISAIILRIRGETGAWRAPLFPVAAAVYLLSSIGAVGLFLLTAEALLAPLAGVGVMAVAAVVFAIRARQAADG